MKKTYRKGRKERKGSANTAKGYKYMSKWIRLAVKYLNANGSNFVFLRVLSVLSGMLVVGF